MRSRLLLFLLLLPLLLLCAPGEAEARARRVSWTKVEVRKGDDMKRVSATLKRLLEKKSRRAKWGKGKRLKLSAKVTRLSWERHDDVLRVSVTVVAKIVGGQSARSKIRIGGRPSERRKIEREALSIVSSGLVTRLSHIARRTMKPADK